MNPGHHQPAPSGQNRRSFIQKAAAVAATVTATGIAKTPVYGQSQAPSTGRVIGANDRIMVAYVGTGTQGQEHLRSQKTYATENNIIQAAVCDVYQKRLDEAKSIAGLTDRSAFQDYRKLLERKDIDAVIVATVDPWHCDVACDALEAGKHIYGEKPMARYLDEGFRIHDTVKKTGKTFVIGSQFCGDRKYHQAADWIREGKLGPLVWAQGSYCRNNPTNSEWTYPIDPDANEGNLDWNLWLGRTPKIPFSPERYFSWHKFQAYNSGLLGNLLPHTVLPLLLATGNPEFPRRVTCTGTRNVSMDREITDTTHVLAEMPSGLTLCVAGSTVNEVGLPEMIRGRQGTLYFTSGQDQVVLKPERPFTSTIEPQEVRSTGGSGDLARLEKNFFDCIRTGATPMASVDLAIRAHVILCLAEMSERLGLMLYFDEKSRKITTGDGKVVPAIGYGSVVPRTT